MYLVGNGFPPLEISHVFCSDTICTINYILYLIFNIYQHLKFSYALIFNGHDFTGLSCDWRGSKPVFGDMMFVIEIDDLSHI